MSWDISIQKFSRNYASVQAIPDDERGVDLGPRSEVHRAVSAIFMGTNWSDPAWGVWDSELGSIEFNLGEADPADGMMLHVRAGSEVIGPIVQLCLANGWQGIDCSSGDFIEKSKNPAEGLEAWITYRNQVIGGPNA